jgi:hypothetical protein
LSANRCVYTNPGGVSNGIPQGIRPGENPDICWHTACCKPANTTSEGRFVGHRVSFGAYFHVGKIPGREDNLEVTKALAALQPLYGKDNIEIVTGNGKRVRGVVRSMKTTQALTTPSVKIEIANGEIVKIPFPDIAEIKDHNGK